MAQTTPKIVTSIYSVILSSVHEKLPIRLLFAICVDSFSLRNTHAVLVTGKCNYCSAVRPNAGIA